MNIYTFENNICKILVKNSVHGIFEFIIDVDDYNKVKNFKWYAGKKGNEGPYCKANLRSYKTNGTIALHRLVTSFLFDVVDHVNGNTLDNRKINLRDGSGGLNQRNRKKSFKKTLPVGVYLCGSKYRARTKENNKNIHLGTFDSIAQASEAYLNFRNTTPQLND